MSVAVISSVTCAEALSPSKISLRIARFLISKFSFAANSCCNCFLRVSSSGDPALQCLSRLSRSFFAKDSKYWLTSTRIRASSGEGSWPTPKDALVSKLKIDTVTLSKMTSERNRVAWDMGVSSIISAWELIRGRDTSRSGIKHHNHRNWRLRCYGGNAQKAMLFQELAGTEVSLKRISGARGNKLRGFR